VSEPTPDTTLALSLQPIEPGFPAVVDTAFTTAITASEAGGGGTQAYFDSLNQTSDFWADLAAGTVTLAPGVDPRDRPVLMASDGNVDLRVQAVWAPDPAGQRVGVLTITTREVSGTGISRLLTVGIVVDHNPSSLVIDEAVFADLLPALYESAGDALVGLAVAFAAASRVESPDVDAETITSMVLFNVSQKAISLGSVLVEWGLDFTAVTWGQVVGEALGVGALMAIPTIIEFLGHTMRHSLVLENLTDGSLAWSVDVIHGEAAVTLPTTVVPARRHGPDPLDPSRTLDLSSELHLLFVNSTRISSLGYVLTLTPSGGPQIQTLVSIPVAGDNVIWVGATTDSSDQVWAKHAVTTGTRLSVQADAGPYRVTLSLNKASGTTDAAYFYCSSLVLAPR
jgi:hypothetical protein